MNSYLNYAREHWTRPDENPPVGLILCADHRGGVAKYALEGCPTRSWRPATTRPCLRRHCWWRRWTRPARCWRVARRPRRRRRKNVDPERGDRICPEQVLTLGERSLTIVRTIPVVPCPQSPLDPLPGKLSHNPTYVRFGLSVRVNVVIAEDVQIRSLSHKKEGRVGSVIRQTSAVEFVVPRLVTVDAHLVRGYHLITHEYFY